MFPILVQIIKLSLIHFFHESKMSKKVISIQFFLITLLNISCDSDDSNVIEKIDDKIDANSIRVEAEELHTFQFEDGSIHELTEEFYSDGSARTLFKINNEIVFDKKYELPKFPEELSKFKAIITYQKMHVQDEVTSKYFTNKFKIENHSMERTESGREKEID